MSSKVMLVSMCCFVFSGCAVNSSTNANNTVPRYNVIEKDLTQKVSSKPVLVAKNAQKVSSKPALVTKNAQKVSSKPALVAKNAQKVSSKPALVAKNAQKVSSKPALVTKKSFELFKGETYKSALVRWARSQGYKGIAWAASQDTSDALLKVVPNNKKLDLDSVDRQIAQDLNVQFDVAMDKKLGYAAIHEWKDYKVKILEIHGDTLEDVMRNLVRDFGWNWNDKKSWRTSKKLHGFSIPFPVVAPAHDIAMVLNQVLKNRPVRSEYHEETQTVFIIDDK